MYNSTSFQIHGNAGNSDDSIAGQVEKLLTFLENLIGQNPDQAIDTFFPGLAEMANYHPLFVHFPIALLTTFFFLDFVGTLFRNDNMRHAASWVLYLGTLGALATVLMGLQAAENVAHGSAVHPIMEQHKIYGLTLTSLAVILTLWRLLTNHLITGMANILHLLLAAIICGLLFLGADLGGLMVYKYGVSVKSVTPPTDNYHHQHSH
jgi:uncharacterized membrane protein